MSDTTLKLINMNDVTAVPVKWLWKPYIPLGKITIIQGDPGEGKTTLALAVAAALSCGKMLPGDTEPREPMNIIYQTAEDGLADTIKPRLEAANADCSHILVIDESKEELSMNDERIEEAIKLTNAKLVILDPIQAYIKEHTEITAVILSFDNDEAGRKATETLSFKLSKEFAERKISISRVISQRKDWNEDLIAFRAAESDGVSVSDFLKGAFPQIT